VRRAAALAPLLFAALAATAGAAPDPLAGLKYRAIGPAISGGRTTAVAGSDADPMVYYAGGAGGGVFKSEDGGSSWRAVFDGQAVAPIGAIALGRDANDVWVGTGESNPRNDVEEGAGVWHSVDGGKTWRHAGLDDAGSISSIAVDPRDPRTVVVGVLGHIFRDGPMRGVYRTRDGGAHWTRALYAGPASGASDVARVPDKPDTLFAGMWQFRRTPWSLASGGPQGGIYRSDDGGAHWRKLSGDGLPAGLTGRIGIAAARGGRIYAIVQSKEGDVWRSDDGGALWRAMPHSPLIGARPFYFSKLFVDPAKRDRLIGVGLILAASDDGARTWKATATEAGWDYHAQWWSADGRRVINGSDEGVILSADAGAHWRQPYSLPFAQPYHVGYDATKPSVRVCVGLQDNSSWCGPSNSDNGVGVLNRDWYVAGPGDGMHAEFDPNDSNFVWTTTTNDDTGQVYLFDARTQQAREVSPSARNTQDAASALPFRFNWDTPIAFEADGTVLVGGNALFASTDRGEHWTALSGDLTRNDRSRQGRSGGPITEDASGAEIYDTILTIAPARDGALWVGTDDGLVQLSRDGGKTWHAVTPPGVPPWGRVSGIEPGVEAGSAFVAIDRHMSGDDAPYVYSTVDDGATWRALGRGLPAGHFVRCVRQDPAAPSILYAGTQRGVYVSFDRGATWRSLRSNMPATAIYDLKITPAGDLLVASHGRGVWILDDLTSLRAWHAAGREPVLYPPATAYGMWRAAPVNTFLDGSLPSDEFVGDDREYGALIAYDLPRKARSVRIDVLGPAGNVVRTLDKKKVSRVPGIHRVGWDLAEEGPVRWTGTFEQNRGPKTGAEAVPGTYRIRLTVDGRSVEQPVTVAADPRSQATLADYRVRHDFLRELNGEIGGVDLMLNRLDAALRRATGARRAALRAFRARLTNDPRNVEDLKTPPELREGLLDLLARVGPTAFQTPNEPQRAEGARLRDLYTAAKADGARLGV
jgi:photosystem II stability/assembly factor-like uncharacterized protein